MRLNLFRALIPLACAVLVAAGGGVRPIFAQSLMDDEVTQRLVAAVEAATELDLYNARCRSDQSGRRTENVNKVLTGRYRITVIGVEDAYFPERSYRKAKERMETDFLERLKAVGGCSAAKTGGLRDTLEARYRDTLGAIE